MSGICRKCVVYRQNKQSHLYLPSSRFLSMKWNQSTHTDVINLYIESLHLYTLHHTTYTTSTAFTAPGYVEPHGKDFLLIDFFSRCAALLLLCYTAAWLLHSVLRRLSWCFALLVGGRGGPAWGWSRKHGGFMGHKWGFYHEKLGLSWHYHGNIMGM